ncbi:MAG: YbhB/YbcL family Raf kinase inhibitor-like protein [Actinomycetota bacterium]
MLRRPSFTSAAVAVAGVAGAVLLAACDTGDGTTLRDPVAPTTLPPETLPPVDTPLPPPPDAALGDAAAGSLPLELDPPVADFVLFQAWQDGAAIDPRYGCDGLDVSPPVSWSELPDGTVDLAISFENLTDQSNGRPTIHWVMAGIDPATVAGVGEGDVPLGAVTGINFFGEVGWTGPCPDPGTSETYALTGWALAQQVELPDATPAAELLDLVADVALDSASVTGTVSR